MQPKRISFYPCCNYDILESYDVLDQISDQIIYCDRSTSSLKYFESISKQVPNAIFKCGDAIQILRDLEMIDVFFYRRDSAGEGGSGLFFWGDQYFPLVVEKLNPDGAKIISDGSNSRGKNWRKIKRTNGAIIYGRKFNKSINQDLIYLKGNGEVITIDVEPVNLHLDNLQ